MRRLLRSHDVECPSWMALLIPLPLRSASSKSLSRQGVLIGSSVSMRLDFTLVLTVS
jgi:hypothetical protein